MAVVWLLCVAVTCLTGVTGQGVVVDSIRLVGGSNNLEGRVEVEVAGEWGTVCDDQWDDFDASVVCKQLGFRNGGVAREKAFFGQGTGPIFLDDVKCDGSEATIDECDMAQTPNCNHTEDAGVICNPNPVNPVSATTTTTQRPTIAPVPDNCVPGGPTLDVRLLGYNDVPGMGIVEVRNGGTWGTVCDDTFDQNAARVVCRSLCFDPEFALPGAPVSDLVSTASDIILDDVRCDGNEARIQDCNHGLWNVHDCGVREVAAVTCIQLDSQPPKPPEPILECRDGFLIVAFNKSRDRNLEAKHLTIPSPGVCNLQYSEDNSTVVVRVPFSQCGTNVTKNSTHLIYWNVIKYDRTSQEGAISRVNTYLVEVYCEMPRNSEVTRPFDPKTEVVTQRATGRFVVTMTFFRNNSFNDPATEFPLRLPIGEWLNVALQLESIDSRLKLVVPDCIATPDTNMDNAVNYPLFTNSCRQEPTLTFFNLNQTRFGYRYQPFLFVNFPQVYLHCGAFVCLLDEVSAQCDRSCNSSKPEPTTTGRRKREAPAKEKIYVRSGPLIVYKLDDSVTVLERVGNPQTYSTTFTLPMESTTPTPSVSHHIGTSVKVVHYETTTTVRTDETSSSGDGEIEYMTSSTLKSTSVVNDVTTKKHDVTTKAKSTTPSPTTTSTEGNVWRNTTTRKEEVITTYKAVTTSTSKEKISTHFPTPVPDDGFFVERGHNPNNPSSSQDQKVNTLKGYVPFSSSSPRLLPGVLNVVFVCVSVLRFLT